MVLKDYVQIEIQKDEYDEITVFVTDMWECTTLEEFSTWDEDLFGVLDELFEKYNTLDKTILFKSWGKVV